METKSIKITQLTAGAILLLVGILFLVITLGGALIPSFYKTANIFIIMAIPLFLIFFVEGAVYWISQSLGMDEEKLKNFGRKDIVSQAATAYAFLFRYGSLIKNIIVFPTILVFAIFIIYNIIVKPMNTEGVMFSTNFYIQLGIYLAWFIPIRRFFTGFLYRIGSAARKNLPFYSIEPDGVMFNLRLNRGAFPRIVGVIGFIAGISAVFLLRQYRIYFAGIFVLSFILIASGIGKKIVIYPLKIKFDEIDEIRELGYVETRSLLQYQIGPNVTLEAQGAKDMYDFMRKKIERPNVYVMTPFASTAKTLIIKGPKIFYLSAVENEDLNDLISAFKNYKVNS